MSKTYNKRTGFVIFIKKGAIIVAVVLEVVLIAGVVYARYAPRQNKILVGDDRDSHGCIGQDTVGAKQNKSVSGYGKINVFLKYCPTVSDLPFFPKR